MGNYPEGVTGNEWQIVGPEREYSDERLVTCMICDRESEQLLDIAYYNDGLEWAEWKCSLCNSNNVYEHYPQFDWSEDYL